MAIQDVQKDGDGGTFEVWPSLKLEEWRETKDTLHMWTQIVGKVRLALSAPENHWWQVPLYVTPRGLTTSAIPDGTARTFEIDFDFIAHRLDFKTSDGLTRSLPLAPRSVAAFYREVMETLDALGIKVKIWTTPVEVENPIPFEQDETHAAYDAEYAARFWRVLVQADRILKKFRGQFLGKSSPVHFFWGSFDLAVTRFSGRRAPAREGADAVTREAYSHEVISHGFWPGGGPFPDAAFYSYAAPAPDGYKDAQVCPAGQTIFNAEMSEFILPYEAVRSSNAPEEMLNEFLHSTYEAGATLAKWDRAALERTTPTK